MHSDNQPNRRQNERIPANENVCFLDAVSGRHREKLMDLSAEGMLIQTRVSLPLTPVLQIVLFTGKELLNIPAHVVRVSAQDGAHTGVGVRLLCNSAKYTQFVVKHALIGDRED